MRDFGTFGPHFGIKPCPVSDERQPPDKLEMARVLVDVALDAVIEEDNPAIATMTAIAYLRQLQGVLK